MRRRGEDEVWAQQHLKADSLRAGGRNRYREEEMHRWEEVRGSRFGSWLAVTLDGKADKQQVAGAKQRVVPGCRGRSRSGGSNWCRGPGARSLAPGPQTVVHCEWADAGWLPCPTGARV